MLEGVEIRVRQCCRRTFEDSRFVQGNFAARLDFLAGSWKQTFLRGLLAKEVQIMN